MSRTAEACPRCGCPARVIIIRKARVRCELGEDGGIGRVLSASKDVESVIGYECGGRHSWETEQ